MIKYTYYPQGVCSRKITFDIDYDGIYNIEFTGGCNGNLNIISRWLDGWTVEEIEEEVAGNICGGRRTSCADQLAKAVREAYETLFLDIRGYSCDEGVYEVEQFINSAFRTHIQTVTIIHGKGERGSLRNAVHQILESMNCVKEYCDGSYSEGGNRVTIVTLSGPRFWSRYC